MPDYLMLRFLCFTPPRSRSADTIAAVTPIISSFRTPLFSAAAAALIFATLSSPRHHAAFIRRFSPDFHAVEI